MTSAALLKLDPNDGKLDVERYADALKRCLDIDEIKNVKTTFEVFVDMLRRTGRAGEEAHLAGVEIKTRADRRLGELLAELKPHMSKGGGDQKSHARITGTNREPVIETPPKLADLGISKKESAACQKLAAVSEKAFEKAIVDSKNAGKPPTAAVVSKAASPKETGYTPAFDAHDEADALVRSLRNSVHKWPSSASRSPLVLKLKMFVSELEKA